MSQESMWWYARDDQHLGPFSETDFKVLAASGQLRPTDRVWKEDFTDWVTAASVADLLPPQAAPPPLPPRPPRASNGQRNPPNPGASSIPTPGEQALSMTTLFRSIMISSMVMALLSIIAGAALVQTLPMPLQQYLVATAAEEPGGGQMILGGLFVLLLPLIIAAIIGAWNFKPWARTLNVVLTILWLPMSLAMGPVIMNPWEGLFMSLAETLNGIFLAMMFLPPIAGEFQRNKT